MNKLPSKKWALQDAKAKFSELIDTAIAKGPQVVTRRGIDTAVVVPMDEWERMSRPSGPTLKDLLLGDGPRFDNLIPKRRKWKLRPPISLD
ncbi:MAG: type II toxin-antitoxin system Phd/YefM family antitoxin [Rhodospirillaceae bacterium]|nr:type II toxin-antitoxin system Phd/YefM family antitoxin [Rhodospirillaceae bacterium]